MLINILKRTSYYFYNFHKHLEFGHRIFRAGRTLEIKIAFLVSRKKLKPERQHPVRAGHSLHPPAANGLGASPELYI